MPTTKTATYVLLMEDAQGDTVGIRFASADAARVWEEAHESAIGTVRGVVRLVTKTEALSDR